MKDWRNPEKESSCEIQNPFKERSTSAQVVIPLAPADGN